MITITKIFGFEACHHLPKYDGVCKNLHGHSYKLHVTVGGGLRDRKEDPKTGMVMDFKDLKKIVEEEVINKYDHTNLNDFFKNPTAEIMCRTFAVDIDKRLPTDVRLVSVKLWETEDSYAECCYTV